MLQQLDKAVYASFESCFVVLLTDFVDGACFTHLAGLEKLAERLFNAVSMHCFISSTEMVATACGGCLAS